MSKKQFRADEVRTYYAALHGREIALATIRKTPLEAAEANASLNPSAGSDYPPPAHIIEIKLGWNIEATLELPV